MVQRRRGLAAQRDLGRRLHSRVEELAKQLDLAPRFGVEAAGDVKATETLLGEAERVGTALDRSVAKTARNQ